MKRKPSPKREPRELKSRLEVSTNPENWAVSFVCVVGRLAGGPRGNLGELQINNSGAGKVRRALRCRFSR